MLIWLYTMLLRLYPKAYYNQFADEMEAIFRQLMAERSPNDFWLPVREILSLLVGIVRERQQGDMMDNAPFWHKLPILLLPVLLGVGILAFRPVHYFYFSDKAWLLFGVVTVAIVLMGWLRDGQLTALALPSLGVMVFIMQSILGWISVPQEIWIGLLLAILIGLSGNQRLPWRSWLLPVLAAPIIAVGFGLVGVYVNSAFANGSSLEGIYHDNIYGALLPINRHVFALLIGLLLAYRFGSKAVLLLLGYVFFDLLGLSASLPYDEGQRILGAVHLALFLLVIPILTVQVTQPKWERIIILGMVMLAYLMTIIMVVLTQSFEPFFVTYRFNEMCLTLLGLYLALSIYPYVQHKRKPFLPSEPDFDDDAELVPER